MEHVRVCMPACCYINKYSTKKDNATSHYHFPVVNIDTNHVFTHFSHFHHLPVDLNLYSNISLPPLSYFRVTAAPRLHQSFEESRRERQQLYLHRKRAPRHSQHNISKVCSACVQVAKVITTLNTYPISIRRSNRVIDTLMLARWRWWSPSGSSHLPRLVVLRGGGVLGRLVGGEVRFVTGGSGRLAGEGRERE